MTNIINLSYLQEISGGDSGFIKEMLELYINTTAQEADLFDELLTQNNIEAIGSLAHKMKAPIQMLGANDLFNNIRSLEGICKNKTELEKIPGLVRSIQNEIHASIGEVRTLLTTL